MIVGSTLTSDELRRHAHHIILPEIGYDGQRRLKGGRVLLVGAGGLGSPAVCTSPCRASGRWVWLTTTSLARPTSNPKSLHGTAAVGGLKLASAEARLHDLNPYVAIERFDTRLVSGNSLDIISASRPVAVPRRSARCDRLIVPYCHHGIRSLDAQRILMAAGFTNVRSLAGRHRRVVAGSGW